MEIWIADEPKNRCKPRLAVELKRADLKIQYFNSHGDAISMNLGKDWRVDVSDKLIEELHSLFGVPNVHLSYDPNRLQASVQKQQDQAA